MASTSITTLLSLITLSLLSPLTTQISDESITNAAEILSNSGFNSMSLTLPLISTTLISTLPSSTLFSPTDASFSLSGQPSLSLLQFHFCPRFYSFPDLQSLPYGSQIPTLNPNFSLTITSSSFDDDIFINGVRLRNPPIFNDGSLVVFAIDTFFNPNFTIETPTPECAEFANRNETFLEASNALRSRGYSLMAAFLDLQLIPFSGGNDERALTVFAPTDVALEGYTGNFSNWVSVFLRHVVGCELGWGDLVGLNDGSVLNTFLKGIQIKITHNNTNDDDDSAFTLMINDRVTVDLPEMYRNEWIVVHGLSGVLGVSSEESDHGSSNDWEGVNKHVDEF